jgi:hypothetical protein
VEIELIHRFRGSIEDGPPRIGEARVYGEPAPDGHWHGWIAFFPAGGGRVLVTERETSQPGRAALVYWSRGLTRVYMQGALARARAVDPRKVLARLREHLEQDARDGRQEARLLASAARARQRMAETEELAARRLRLKAR